MDPEPNKIVVEARRRQKEALDAMRTEQEMRGRHKRLIMTLVLLPAFAVGGWALWRNPPFVKSSPLPAPRSDTASDTAHPFAPEIPPSPTPDAPQDFSASLDGAADLVAKGRHKDALNLLAQIEEPGELTGHQQVRYRIVKGDAALGLEQLSLAIESYDLALSGASPDETAALQNNLAYIWARTGDNLQRAEEYGRMAIAHEPGNVVYLDTLASVLIRTDRASEAVPMLKEALKQTSSEPAKAILHNRLGDCYAAMKRLSDAVAEWRMCVALEPGDSSVWKKIENFSPVTDRPASTPAR